MANVYYWEYDIGSGLFLPLALNIGFSLMRYQTTLPSQIHTSLSSAVSSAVQLVLLLIAQANSAAEDVQRGYELRE